MTEQGQTTLPGGAETKDYPKILGVPADADQATVKRRYRQLVRELHPDQGGDAERFKEVGEAYEVLSDPRKRTAWEEARQMAAMPPRQRSPWSSGVGPGDIADLFDRIYRPGREPEAVIRLNVDALEALEGSTKQIRLGENLRQVRLPAGLEDGTRLLLDGNTLVAIEITPHPVYRVEGEDLEVDVPVSYPELVLGAEIDVPTPTGTARVRIKPGTQPGTRLRLGRRGARIGDGRGDLYAKLAVQVPRHLDERARERLEEYQKASPDTAAQARKRLTARAGRKSS